QGLRRRVPRVGGVRVRRPQADAPVLLPNEGLAVRGVRPRGERARRSSTHRRAGGGARAVAEGRDRDPDAVLAGGAVARVPAVRAGGRADGTGDHPALRGGAGTAAVACDRVPAELDGRGTDAAT